MITVIVQIWKQLLNIINFRWWCETWLFYITEHHYLSQLWTKAYHSCKHSSYYPRPSNISSYPECSGMLRSPIKYINSLWPWCSLMLIKFMIISVLLATAVRRPDTQPKFIEFLGECRQECSDTGLVCPFTAMGKMRACGDAGFCGLLEWQKSKMC